MSKPSSRPAPESSSLPRAVDARVGAGVGLAVVAGYLLQDLALVATGGRPQDLAVLAPHAGLALALGAAYGGLAGRLARRRPAWLAAVVLALVVWSVVPSVAPWRFSFRAAWLPRALLVLALTHAAALAVGRHRLGRARAGLCLGVLGAAAIVWLSAPKEAPHGWLTAAAGLALPLGYLTRGRARAAGELLLVALVAWRIVPVALASLHTERPDLPPPSAPAAPGAPDLLLVVLDTLRADRLGCYGHERETTPHLDAWVADHFTLYERARATSSWTLPSHASLFTGLLPSEHGASHPGASAYPMRPGTPTLAERLRAAGYRTGGVFANNVYLRPRFHVDAGFEHFDDRKAGMLKGYLTLPQLLGASQRVGHLGYRDAGTITDLALAWLDRVGTERPRFLTLNYMDVHTPNLPPPPFDRAFDERRPVDVLEPADDLQGLLYDRELLHLDSELDRLLRGLVERGSFDSTAIVITSDHGEALGDHGFEKHGWTLYEELLHVPLLVKPAGTRRAERSAEELTGADVFRLAHGLVGLEPPPRTTPPEAPTAEWYVGQDGVGEVFLERYPERDLDRDLLTWIEGGRKLIVSSTGRVEAYDLALDPHEQAPLQLSEEERAQALARARAWWDAHPPPDSGPVEVTPEDLERLRHLGYVDEAREGTR